MPDLALAEQLQKLADQATRPQGEKYLLHEAAALLREARPDVLSMVIRELRSGMTEHEVLRLLREEAKP